MNTSIAERPPDRAFIAAALGAALVAVAATLASTWAMAPMGGMPMPGGWTMSMTWMLMPGQSAAGAALSFLGMWSAMTVAMMLPSLAPALRRYRAGAAARDRRHLARLTWTVAAGYFAVWVTVGAAIFPVGLAVAEAAMRHPPAARAVPAAAGAVLLAGGLLQFTPWKRRRLACCRPAPPELPQRRGEAWRYGLRLGGHCVGCCAGLTAIQLAAGVMDLRVMAVVMAAITGERLAVRGDLVARVTGGIAVAAGTAQVLASMT
jgi:predicted metal-binding membrane protein